MAPSYSGTTPVTNIFSNGIGQTDWYGSDNNVFGQDPTSFYTKDFNLDLKGLGLLNQGNKTSFFDSLLGGLGKGVSSGGLTRLAGSLGSSIGTLFGGGGGGAGAYTQQAIDKLNELAKQTTSDIDQRISNIYPGLTEKDAAEAVREAYDRFAKTAQTVQAQGRADLDISPNISNEYDRLGSRVDQIQNQYSLANRIGGYEKLALDPPVVSMDVDAIRSVADWVDPETNQMKSQYKALYDYSDPQTKQFLYGNRATADAIGRYYGSSGDVAGLMNYGNVV
jgi:hypothetical protein